MRRKEFLTKPYRISLQVDNKPLDENQKWGSFAVLVIHKQDVRPRQHWVWLHARSEWEVMQLMRKGLNADVLDFIEEKAPSSAKWIK